MSYAKYMEDDLEAIAERRYLADHSWIHTDISVYCRAPITARPTVAILVVDTAGSLPKTHKRKKMRLTCKDCGCQFSFSHREQLFFEEKGWNIPVRCKVCRELRKTRFSMHSSS